MVITQPSHSNAIRKPDHLQTGQLLTGIPVFRWLLYTVFSSFIYRLQTWNFLHSKEKINSIVQKWIIWEQNNSMETTYYAVELVKEYMNAIA